MKILLTDQRGAAGDMASFFGAGIQEATKQDSNGLKFYQALPNQWSGLYLHALRSPNGTDIYDIVDTNDADVREALDTLVPTKGCESHVTWPPQLDVSTDIQALTSDYTARLVYGNEPPSHMPSVWADGAAYASDAETWYNGLSAQNQNRAYFQTGKPEVIRYSLAGSNTLAKHQDCLDELSTKILAGDLPPRIATTHKLSDQYQSDRYDLYKQMILDYQSYFGNDVRLMFHEYKLKDAQTDTIDQLQIVMEFWLVMSRLKFEYRSTLNGGCFQQLSGAGPNNIFGLTALPQNGGVWRVGGMYALWNLMYDMRTRAYMYSTHIDKPDSIQLEAFGTEREHYIYFVNKGSKTNFGVPGQYIDYLDSDLVLKQTKWRNELPANSVGRIRRKTCIAGRIKTFFFSPNANNPAP